MMQQHILHATDYHSMPWKNGGGVTQEIQRYPATDAFTWRLSIAQVAEDGPFSFFHGYQRIISVIEGKGLLLQVAKCPTRRLVPFDSFAFTGDHTARCHLLEGSIRDLNVIYLPEKHAVRFQWLFGSNDKQHIFTSASDVLLFNSADSCQIDSPPTPSATLTRHDTLWLKNPARQLRELWISASSPCALIEIWPLHASIEGR